MRVLFCNWRDTRHPEGGGSEVYVESVARALAAAGDDVTRSCAPGIRARSPDEVHEGVRYHRVGSKLGVYPRVLLTQLRATPRAGSTSWSTSRTACRSPRPWPPARPW